MHTLTTFTGRILISLIFIAAGAGKIADYAGTAGYMESQGVPTLLLPLVILLELGGGLLIAVGFQTRITAFLIAGFCVLSAILFHADFGDKAQSIQFMKNLALAGGLLILMVHGPGLWSLDEKFGKTRTETH